MRMCMSVLQMYMATVPADHPKVVERFVLGLFVPFFLQVAVVSGGCLALWLTAVRFEANAAFALSFAVAATILGVTGVVVASRSLQARAAPSVGQT